MCYVIINIILFIKKNKMWEGTKHKKGWDKAIRVNIIIYYLDNNL